MTSAKTAIRRGIKRALASGAGSQRAAGLTILIYHRIGGGTTDELDLTVREFAAQVDHLADPANGHRVVSLDDACDELEAGDDSPKVVLTFDDGFSDVHDHAWPLLREAGLPFTTYVATAYVGDVMQWEGSTATGEAGRGMTWEQLGELAGSDLVTIGNHTHSHARPEALTADELDRCTDLLQERIGVTPRHFAYTWGITVPHAEHLLRERFRSAVTGDLGRNHPDTDPMRFDRVPVRGSDPLSFFAAKLVGGLGPERAYERVVETAKRLGVPA